MIIINYFYTLTHNDGTQSKCYFSNKKINLLDFNFRKILALQFVLNILINFKKSLK